MLQKIPGRTLDLHQDCKFVKKKLILNCNHSEGHYAVVPLETSIIYFGGIYNGSASKDIYRYSGASTWEGLGQLKTARQQWVFFHLKV